MKKVIEHIDEMISVLNNEARMLEQRKSIIENNGDLSLILPILSSIERLPIKLAVNILVAQMQNEYTREKTELKNELFKATLK